MVYFLAAAHDAHAAVEEHEQRVAVELRDDEHGDRVVVGLRVSEEEDKIHDCDDSWFGYSELEKGEREPVFLEITCTGTRFYREASETRDHQVCRPEARVVF